MHVIRTFRPGCASSRSLSAYTLAEAVVSLAIIGTVGAVALPRLGRSMDVQRVEAAAQRVAADLTLARRNAMNGGGPRTVIFNVVANQYTLSGMTRSSRGGGPYDVDLGAEPYVAELLGAGFGPSGAEVQQVTFDSYGVADNSGSVTLRCGGQYRAVLLDAASGNVSINRAVTVFNEMPDEEAPAPLPDA